MDNYLIDTANLRLTELELLTRLLVAIGIGFLIGLEREHSAMAKKEHIFAGVRTFVFLSLLGFTGGLMYHIFSPVVFAAVLLAVITLTCISYWITANKGDIGGTSELTGVLVVLLGGLTIMGYVIISLVTMVVMLVLLSSKLRLQSFIEKISNEELYALIRFIVVALLIFPFLPNEQYGPYDVINPREVGWVVVLTSAVGFAGYIAMRILGVNKGIFITSVLGGLISSTVVTWVLSKRSKEDPTLSRTYASGIMAASSIMAVRVILWIIIFNKNLGPQIFIAMAIVFLATMGIAYYFFLRNKSTPKDKTEMNFGKPLKLDTALYFGAIYIIVGMAIAYMNDTFSQQGIYITSIIAGLTDLDAVTISLAKQSLNYIPELIALTAILIACLSNTLFKLGIAFWAGSKEMRKYILLGNGLTILTLAIAFLIINI